MIRLLLIACWINAASSPQAKNGFEQALRLPPVAASLQAAPKQRNGAITFAIYASTRLARLRAGGVGTMRNPYFIEFPLAFYIRIRIMVALPESQPSIDAPPKPPPGAPTVPGKPGAGGR